MRLILIAAAVLLLCPAALRGEQSLLSHGKKIACSGAVARHPTGAPLRCLLAFDHTFTNHYDTTNHYETGPRVVPEILCRGGTPAFFDENGHLTSCLLAQDRVFRNQYASAGAAKSGWTLEIPCGGAGLFQLDSTGNVRMCILSREREFQNVLAVDQTLRVVCAPAEPVSLNARGELQACMLARSVLGCRAGQWIGIAAGGRVHCGGVFPLPVPTSY